MPFFFSLPLLCYCWQAWPAPMFFHSPTKAGGYILHPCSPITLLKLVSAYNPHRWCSLSAWHWWPGDLAFLGPMRLKQRDSSWQVVTCRAQAAYWNTAPVHLWKRPIYFSWSFSLRVRLQVCHISRGFRVAIREHKPVDTIFVLSVGLTTAQQYFL